MSCARGTTRLANAPLSRDAPTMLPSLSMGRRKCSTCSSLRPPETATHTASQVAQSRLIQKHQDLFWTTARRHSWSHWKADNCQLSKCLENLLRMISCRASHAGWSYSQGQGLARAPPKKYRCQRHCIIRKCGAAECRCGMHENMGYVSECHASATTIPHLQSAPAFCRICLPANSQLQRS